MSKIPALLVRHNKRPILATVYIGEDTFYVVEVTSRGGPKYALGNKVKTGFYWLIPPTTKAELWNAMKQAWEITIE